MSRHKANKPRRPRPPRPARIHQHDNDPGVGMTPAEIEFFAEMKKLADGAYNSAVTKLREKGVAEEDIEHLETGVRAQCIAEIWEMGLEQIFMDLLESNGKSISVRDAVAEKLMKTQLFPRSWDEDGEEEEGEEPVKA